MKTRKLNKAGFSLIELIIVMVISVIVFAAIGIIIIYANQAWQRSVGLSAILNDARVAKEIIVNQTGGAITSPFSFIYHRSYTNPFVVKIPVGGSFYINNNRNTLAFNTVDHKHVPPTFRMDEYSYNQNNHTIVYNWWYATTNSFGKPQYVTNPITPGQYNTMTLVNNVAEMTVTPIGPVATATELSITIVQSKQLVPGSPELAVSSSTFIINVRNK